MSEARHPSTYHITFACYGQHLHGDECGSVDRRHNQPGGRLAPEDHRRRAAESVLMTEPPYVSGYSARRSVLEAIRDVCDHRQWTLGACHVRTTHVHVVVATTADPDRVMGDFKAYASRKLNASGEEREKRWARGGSFRCLTTPERIEAAVGYVVEGQGTPMAVWMRPGRDEQPLPHGRGSERAGGVPL